MPKLIQLTVVFVLSLTQVAFGENGIKTSMKRSYHVPSIAVVNDARGLQYFPAGPLFASLPTQPSYLIPNPVLIPNQIGLPATPVASLVLPPSGTPPQEFLEPATPVQAHRVPSAHYYKPKHRSSGHGQQGKRPATYVNSIYGRPVKMKPLSSSPSQNQKVSSVAVQSSIDLSGQFSHESASRLYPSTAEPPVGSTYGPAKAVDVQHKHRTSPQTVYHRLKGSTHRHPYYPPKKLRVYSHVHKDHVHNHYLPPKHSASLYKPGKYVAPAYLPTAPESRPPQENAAAFAYHPGSHVRFPEKPEPSAGGAPGEVTQAIIKSPGVINNYDASIPIHVPSKKPYQFEVSEILKNSDLHFVQENPAAGTNDFAHAHNALQLPYQNALLFNQAAYPQPGVIAAPNPFDTYGLPAAYQTNQIVSDQDLGTSESVRVPVAIIRGAHNFAGQGMFGFTMKRQDETTAGDGSNKREFTPSRRTSDWIPMSGNGVPLLADAGPSANAPQSPADPFGHDYFSPPANKEPAKGPRLPVGDIISGKIPEEFAPKELGAAKMAERERRKGSVIDVYPVSGSKVGDTSDLVVSSVIKFS